jgi:DNA-binding LacI/PurR family transcriptional regulator
MVSRRDVAEAAGVSVRTVSNVVSGHPHVSQHVRDRVTRAISELGYRPSELARSLKVGRSGLVGLVLPDLDDPYFAELTKVFVEEGSRRGLTVVIDQADGDPDRERLFIDRTQDGSLFDALVISPIGLKPVDLQAVDARRPVVFLGERLFPRFDQVMIDNRMAAREAVAHLIGTGRRRIAAIGALDGDTETSSLRLAGYSDALASAGIDEDASLVPVVDSFRRQAGASAMQALLDLPEPPDAVFCFTDPLALGALRALALRGLTAPGDVAVVGFDDVEDGRFSTPSLSTVSPDKRQIAVTAFDLLEAKLAGDPPGGEALTIAPHRLEVRESSRAPATGVTRSDVV